MAFYGGKHKSTKIITTKNGRTEIGIRENYVKKNLEVKETTTKIKKKKKKRSIGRNETNKLLCVCGNDINLE